MPWLHFAPLVLLAAAIIILPGLLIGATLRLRNIFLWGSAPALGLGVFGAWLVLWSVTGAKWGWISYVFCLLALVVLLIASRVFKWFSKTATIAQFGRHAHFGVPDNGLSANYRTGVATQSWLAILGVIVMIVIRLFAILPAMGSPDAAPHWGDADFHLQGTLLVAETGNASPIGGLSDLYTPDALSSYYYPTLWHAWTSLLLPFVGVIQATNAAMLAIVVLLWPPAIALLGVALRPHSIWVGFFAPIILSPVAVYPGAIGVSYSIYPYTLSLIGVPTAMAALVLWQRGRGRFWAILYVISIVGSLVAQPSAALFPIVAGFIALAVNFVVWWYRSVRARRILWPTIAIVAACGFSLFALNTIRRSNIVVNLGAFHRNQVLDNPVLGFFDGTVAAISQPWWPWTLTVALAVAGMVILARRRYGWTYIGITIVATVAYMAAAGPDSWLRVLTGPWYKDHLRLGAVSTMLVAVAAAVFASWITERLLGHVLKAPSAIPQVIIGALLAATACVTWCALTPSITQVERLHVLVGYGLDDSKTTPLTEDSVEVLKRLDQNFQPGERILSTHGNGGGFVPAYSELKPMIPLRDLNTSEQRILASRFNDINTDPEICEILNEHNVKGFMADLGREGRGIWGPLAGPPYTDVSSGFKLIDQEGTFKVWRVTACD